MSGVEISGREVLLDDYVRVVAATVRVPAADGTPGRPVRRVAVERGDAAAAVLHRVDTDELVLVRQFRFPASSHGAPRLLELVAGMVDPGEQAAAAICREILEETGYVVRQPRPLGVFFLSPGISSERIFLFYAAVGAAARQAAGGGLPAEDEQLEVVHLPVAAAWQALDRGLVGDAKTVIGLQWLRARRLSGMDAM